MADVELRALAPGDEDELLRIHETDAVRQWWGPPDEGFPWSDEPGTTRFTVLVDGAIAGMIQFWEEHEPRYRHAGIDIFLDPERRGQGIGPQAIGQLVDHLIKRLGHHRITIDPAVANRGAVRAYEKVGFRAVGVMRQYEHDNDGDGWHDCLLMELLAGDR